MNRVCQECGVGSNMVKNKTTGDCQCPPNIPILANGVCYKCDNSSYYYDLTSKSCRLCPNGMSVENSNNTCVCHDSQIYVNGTCTCPSDKPFLSTSGCIACYLPKYFYHVTRECLSCPDGFEYSILVRNCVEVDCGK